MSRITYGPNKTPLQPTSKEAMEAMMKRDAERIALELAGMLVPEDEAEDQSRNNSVVRNQGS